MIRLNPAVLLATALAAVSAAQAAAPSTKPPTPSAKAAAPFEGIVELQQTGGLAEVHMVFQVSRIGVRSDVTMSGLPLPPTATVIKMSNPNQIYVINDAGRMYTAFDARKLWGMMEPLMRSMKRTYTVKKLGKETVQGFPCDHILLTSDQGDTSELWLTKDLLDEELIAKLALGSPTGPNDLAYQQALKEAGVSGYAIRSISKTMGMEMKVEVLRVERKPVPASAFEVPAGYTWTDPNKGFLGGRNPTPEDLERVKEMMRNNPNAPAQPVDTGVQHL